MRFLVDAQLPPALARWLSEKGHEAQHVADLGMERASDADIWTLVQTSRRVIITKDEDFPTRLVVDGAGPHVVWVRLGNTRRRELLAWFSQKLPEIVDAIERGELLVELV